MKLNQRRSQIISLDTIKFLDTNACINNPHWQSSRIMIFLCKYMVVSDTLGSSLFDVLFFLLAVILLELLEKPRSNKDSVTEKRTSFFWLQALLSIMSFVAFFFYSFPFSKGHTRWIAPIKIHNVLTGGILCDDIISELSKIWKSLAI